MKIWFLRIFAFILFSAVFALNIGHAAYAQDFPPDDWQGGAEGGWYVNVAIDDPLNIRSLPSHKSVKVGIVKRGVEVNILDTAENGWRFIEANAISGWVNGIFLANRPVSVEGSPNDSTLETQQKPTVNAAIVHQPVTMPKRSTAPTEIVNNFENEFIKFKKTFRDKDRCFQSLKRRTELVGYTMQIEQNDPVAFRNLKKKYDECIGTLDLDSLGALEKNVRELAVSDGQKIRVGNFTREYTEIIENAAGLLQMGRLMGISFE